MIGYLPGDFTAYPNLTTVAYLARLVRRGVDLSHVRSRRFVPESGFSARIRQGIGDPGRPSTQLLAW